MYFLLGIEKTYENKFFFFVRCHILKKRLLPSRFGILAETISIASTSLQQRQYISLSLSLSLSLFIFAMSTCALIEISYSNTL